MADAVAQVLIGTVAGIFNKWQVTAATVGEYLLAPDRYQRPDDHSPYRRDAGEPRRSGSPQKAHEHRFRLVVRRMSHGDAVGVHGVGNLIAGGVTQVAGRLLHRAVPPGHPLGNVNAAQMARDTEPRAKVLHPSSFIRRLGTQSVIDMHRFDLNGKLSAQGSQYGQQAEGVGPPDRATSTFSWGRTISNLRIVCKTCFRVCPSYNYRYTNGG